MLSTLTDNIRIKKSQGIQKSFNKTGNVNTSLWKKSLRMSIVAVDIE